MHVPVMLDETVGMLVRDGARLFFDGTLGNGGHAEALLEAAGPDAVLIGTDRDRQAIERVEDRLKKFEERIHLAHANFDRMRDVITGAGLSGVDAVILDLGYSSNQIDDADRGFSFSQDGPLDMRMDRTEGLTAEMVVNRYDENDLADVIYQFGEERASRRIARAIVNRRKEKKFGNTADLADVVARAAGGRRGRTHPATRTFQALRIEVNRELDCLKAGLKQGVEALNPSGRMAVISFHSLEDRIVKYFYRSLSGPEGGGFRIITKKPMTASQEEVAENPRSRSAKMRVIEKLEQKEVQES